MVFTHPCIDGKKGAQYCCPDTTLAKPCRAESFMVWRRSRVVTWHGVLALKPFIDHHQEGEQVSGSPKSYIDISINIFDYFAIQSIPEKARSASTKCFLDLTLDIWSKKNSPTRNPMEARKAMTATVLGSWQAASEWLMMQYSWPSMSGCHAWLLIIANISTDSSWNSQCHLNFWQYLFYPIRPLSSWQRILDVDF